MSGKIFNNGKHHHKTFGISAYKAVKMTPSYPLCDGSKFSYYMFYRSHSRWVALDAIHDIETCNSNQMGQRPKNLKCFKTQRNETPSPVYHQTRALKPPTRIIFEPKSGC